MLTARIALQPRVSLSRSPTPTSSPSPMCLADWRIPTKVFTRVCQSALQPRREYTCLRMHRRRAAALAQPLLRHLGINAVISSTRGNSSVPSTASPLAVTAALKVYRPVVAYSARESKMIRKLRSSCHYHGLASALLFSKKKTY